MALYDHLGRKVRAADLKREAAAPSRTGARRWAFASQANSITPERLAAIFAKADRGDLRDLLTLAAEAEYRDLHAGAQLQTRKLALAALPWQVVAPTDAAADVAIAEELQALVDSDLWQPAIVDAMDAVNKPFSALEIEWETGPRWTVKSLTWRDPRHFALDLDDGETLRLRTEEEPVDGVPLDPWKWLVHKPRFRSGPLASRGLCRGLVVAYAIKTLGVGSWLSFLEKYGIPFLLGKYTTGAQESELDDLEAALIALGADGAGIAPSTMELQVIDGAAKAGGGAPHERVCEWIDRQTSKFVLGQTMTSDDGSSLAQAEIHNLVRHDILTADAKALAATFVRDLFRPWIDINYGPRPPGAYPRLVCVTEEPEDLDKKSERIGKWVDRGVEVEKSVVRDMIGVPEPADGADVVGASATPDASVRTPASARRTPTSAVRTQASAGPLADEGADFIDRDLQPDDWRETMGPTRDEVRAAAAGASSFDDFLARLEASTADGDALVKSLATRTLTARGVGDATDDDPKE